MGTSSMIGHWDENTGVVVASYVHYDGYVKGVGQTLATNYNTELGAQKVAYGGYLSSLESDYAKSRETAAHNDRSVVYKTVEEFMLELSSKTASHVSVPYIYLWDGETWFVADRNIKKFEEVEMILEESV